MAFQVDVTVQRLLDAQGASFDVIEPEKKGKWGYSNSGQLSAQNARIEAIDGTLVTPCSTPLCSPSAQGAVPGSPTAVASATPMPAVPRRMSSKHPYSFADVSLFCPNKHILSMSLWVLYNRPPTAMPQLRLFLFIPNAKSMSLFLLSAFAVHSAWLRDLSDHGHRLHGLQLRSWFPRFPALHGRPQ